MTFFNFHFSKLRSNQWLTQGLLFQWSNKSLKLNFNRFLDFIANRKYIFLQCAEVKSLWQFRLMFWWLHFDIYLSISLKFWSRKSSCLASVRISRPPGLIMFRLSRLEQLWQGVTIFIEQLMIINSSNYFNFHGIYGKKIGLKMGMCKLCSRLYF